MVLNIDVISSVLSSEGVMSYYYATLYIYVTYVYIYIYIYIIYLYIYIYEHK